MKDIFIVASAGLMVFLLLRKPSVAQPNAGSYWVSNEGNTGFPLQARTGDLGISDYSLMSGDSKPAQEYVGDFAYFFGFEPASALAGAR